MKRIEIAAPLRHRRFRTLFAGQSVSAVGDWLDYLAVIVLVTYTWRYGAGALAALSITMVLPWVALGPVAGVLADRIRDKKRILVGCDLARAGLVLGYLAAPNLPVLLALVFAKSVFGTLFLPAQQTTIRFTVPREDLLSAMSLSVFTNQAAKVAGPALGGLIVASWGADAAFLVDAGTFLASAVLLTTLRLERPAESGTANAPGGTARKAGFRADLAEGLGFIVRTPALVMVIVSMGATIFLVFTFDTLSPLAMRQLGVHESELGLVVAAVGLGAVSGTLVVSQWGRRLNSFVLMGSAQLVAGLLVTNIGASLGMELKGVAAVWAVVGFGLGFSSAGIMIVFPYVLQRETPDELIGRVTATASSIPVVLQLAAPPLGAWLATRYSIGLTFNTAGPALILLGIAVIGYGRHTGRRTEAAAAPPRSGQTGTHTGAAAGTHTGTRVGDAVPDTPAELAEEAELAQLAEEADVVAHIDIDPEEAGPDTRPPTPNVRGAAVHQGFLW